MSTATQDAARRPSAPPLAHVVQRYFAKHPGLPERYYPAAALLFLCAFAFYVATLAPGLMPGDTGDMVLAASTLREAHPPGYPLYALLGKLFTALPIGDVPYRANLMAAFLGGLSVAFVFLALTTLTRHAVASLAGALLFAFNYLFWTYFILAETFCLNNFCLALITFLALLWRERHRQDPGGSAERQMLVLLAATAGLSMGNHHTMVLTFPGILLFVAATDRTALRPARLAALTGWFGFGLALAYAYLPIAAMVHHDHHWEDSGTLKGLLRLFLRAKYGTFQLAPGEGRVITPPQQAESYFGALTTQFLWPGFLLGLAGLTGLIRGDRRFLLYSGGAFLLGVTFVLKANIDPKPTAYDAATLERFYQLPNFFFLLWAGYGLAMLARWLESAGEARRQSCDAPEPAADAQGGGLGTPASPPTLPRTPPRARLALVALLALCLPAALLARNYRGTSLHNNWLYPRFMTNIMDTLPRDCVLLAWTDTVGMGADYLVDGAKYRPDVVVVKVGLVGSDPYRSTVRRLYPHVNWPGAAPGSPFSLGEFIQANLPHRRIFMDGLPIKVRFPVVRYGLIYEIRPTGTIPRAKEVLDTNDALWKRFDLRQVDTALYPANSMCYSVVVFYYLFNRFATANECNHFRRYAEALGHLEACQRMDPMGYVARSTPWRRQMAVTNIGLGRTDEALRHLALALKEAPKEAETYRLLALAHEQKGDKATAERHARKFYGLRKAEEKKPSPTGKPRHM